MSFGLCPLDQTQMSMDYAQHLINIMEFFSSDDFVDRIALTMISKSNAVDDSMLCLTNRQPGHPANPYFIFKSPCHLYILISLQILLYQLLLNLGLSLYLGPQCKMIVL
jgi:hypothetical protein